jgi:MoxR-like ATPase
MQLPGNARTLLRDAVRNHPNLTAEMLGGRKVNELPKDDLLLVASDLDIDVIAIVSNAAGKIDVPGRATVSLAQAASPEPDAIARAEIEDEITATEEAAPIAMNYSAEASAIRKQLALAMVEGDFTKITETLESLVEAAHKPAEIVTQIETVYVDVAPTTDGTASPVLSSRPAPVPSPSGTSTWGKLFGVTGARGATKINTFTRVPGTPDLETNYKFPQDASIAILASMGRGRNVWLHGPAGTGKTTWPMQFCARTGRPFSLIACDDTTEAPELVGMTVPHQGGVRWQDGVLTAAMRIPHNVILIDEPTVARAGALMVLQSVLAGRMLSIKETGEVVRCAEGVRFLVADNTNGTGGGTAEGYEGTRRMNRAMLDRFSAFVKFDYLSEADETKALVAHTGCTSQLARMLVECASLTRKARVTHALGLRRLIAWAEALTDGLDPRMAFEYTILNSCTRDDREPIEQACALGLDKKAVANAIAGLASPAQVTAGPTVDFAG